MASQPSSTATPPTQTNPSASTTAATSSNTSLFGSGSAPSIYLIAFVVIVVLLVLGSSIVAARSLLLRRRLHQAWADAGYSDTFFFDPEVRRSLGLPTRTPGGGRKKQTVLGQVPRLWETLVVGRSGESGEGLLGSDSSVEEDVKGKARMERAFEKDGSLGMPFTLHYRPPAPTPAPTYDNAASPQTTSQPQVSVTAPGRHRVGFIESLLPLPLSEAARNYGLYGSNTASLSISTIHLPMSDLPMGEDDERRLRHGGEVEVCWYIQMPSEPVAEMKQDSGDDDEEPPLPDIEFGVGMWKVE